MESLFDGLTRNSSLSHCLESSNVLLVHGYPIGTAGEAKDLKYGHAWLERGPLMFDPQTGNVLPVGFAEKLGKIDPKESKKYTLSQAHELAYENGHYGPWEEVPEDAVFKND